MVLFVLFTEFTTVDEDGASRQLESGGVVSLRFADANGDAVYSQGLQVGMNKRNYWTYPMLGDGRWAEPVSNEDTSTKRRRKKRQANENKGPTLKVDHYVPYINCDRPLVRDRLCYTAVQTYKDPSKQETVSNQQVRIFMRDPNSSEGRFVGQSSTYTNHLGIACLITACGLEHEIVVTDSDFKQMKAFDDQFVPAEVDTKLLQGGYRIRFQSPTPDEVRTEAYSRGPVYPYSYYSCSNSDLTAYAFSFYVSPPPWPGDLDVKSMWDSNIGFFYKNSYTYSYNWGRYSYSYTYTATPLCGIAIHYDVSIQVALYLCPLDA